MVANSNNTLKRWRFYRDLCEGVSEDCNAMKKFEYEIIHAEQSVAARRKPKTIMNEMGDQGWELVDVHSQSFNQKAGKAVMFFKRETYNSSTENLGDLVQALKENTTEMRSLQTYGINLNK